MSSEEYIDDFIRYGYNQLYISQARKYARLFAIEQLEQVANSGSEIIRSYTREKISELKSQLTTETKSSQ